MGDNTRRVYMIRHAKSDWGTPGLKDYDRPLNDRGERDAPAMGARLKEMNILPGVIISSTAKRAAQTAKKIAKAIGYDKEAIKWHDKLYHCTPDVYEEVLYELDSNVNSVFIVSHNPGITDFVNQLSPQFHTDNMPTCGIVGAEFDLEDWTAFSKVEKKVVLFEYPKKYI